MPPLNVVSMRIYPPSLMQVSVPGIYQKPAPYREQILTYSTALALTGRSAACAPLMAIRPAAEPRIRLLTIFILASKLRCREGFRIRWVKHPKAGSLTPSKNRSVVSRLRTHPHEREGLKRTTCNGTIQGPPPPPSSELCMRNLCKQNTLLAQLSLSSPTVSPWQHLEFLICSMRVAPTDGLIG